MLRLWVNVSMNNIAINYNIGNGHTVIVSMSALLSTSLYPLSCQNVNIRWRGQHWKVEPLYNKSWDFINYKTLSLVILQGRWFDLKMFIATIHKIEGYVSVLGCFPRRNLKSMCVVQFTQGPSKKDIISECFWLQCLVASHLPNPGMVKAISKGSCSIQGLIKAGSHYLQFS